MDLARFLPERDLLVNTKGYPSCIRMTLIPTLEASLSMMKVLNFFGMANTRVEFMVVFNWWKDSLVAIDQLKVFFLRNSMSGGTIFP